jgi:hypothetical protein
MFDRPGKCRRVANRALTAAVTALCLAAMFRPALAASSRPDLRVSHLSLSRGVAHLGEQVEAGATIENIGGVGITGVKVRFSLGPRQVGPDYLVDLPAGGKAEVSMSFEARPEGKQEFMVEADPDNSIAEDSELNNTAKRTLGILSLPDPLSHAPHSPAPDVPQTPAVAPPAPAIQAVELEPRSPRPGTEVTARITVRNPGGALEDARLRMTLNGKALTPDQTLSLGEDTTATVTRTFTVHAPGDNALSVAVVGTGSGDQALVLADRSETFMVSAPPAPKPAAPAPKPVAAPPNLACEVETIDGVHYFDGRVIRVRVRNTSRASRASPEMLGIRRTDAASGEWVARLPIRALQPGETAVVDVPVALGEQTYEQASLVAVVDADNDIDEGPQGERDNQSAPFRLKKLPEPAPAAAETPAIAVTAPGPGETIYIGKPSAIHWQARGPIGDTVDVAVTNASGSSATLARDTANDGVFEWTPRNLDPGTYRVTVSAAGVEGQSAVFQIRASAKPRPKPAAAQRPAAPPRVNVGFPTANADLYVGEIHELRWTAGGSLAGDVPLHIELLEAGHPENHWMLASGSTTAGAGAMQWSVPANPTLLGRYILRFSDPRGRVLGTSAEFNIYPRFVGPLIDEQSATAPNRLTADLAVTNVAFQGNQLHMTIANYGPDEVPVHVVTGLRIRAYFVRTVPIKSDSDYQVCTYTDWRVLPPDIARDVSLGSNLDCRFGLRSDDERFKFALMRVEIPHIVDTSLSDPQPGNNLFKFYYPK